MPTRRVLCMMGIIFLLSGVACAEPDKGPRQTKPTPKASAADVAIKQAAAANRYIFITVFKAGDPAGKTMLAAVQSGRAKLSQPSDFVSVDFDAPANRALLKRYDLDRAPLPITIALAPNGALTASFPKAIKGASALSAAFVSTGQSDVLKVLQSAKLAAVCLQNPNTKHNKESLTAAQGLRSYTRLAGAFVPQATEG